MDQLSQIILYVTAFFTASISGAIGMVGGIILLSVMAQFYPMQALIPLHGFIQLVSNFSRAIILIPNVNWKICGVFIIGALLGGAAGSQLILEIPDALSKIILGLFVLWVILKPKQKEKIEIPGKWFVLGGISAFLSLFVGAIGVLVGSFFLNEGLEKKQLVASQAICQFIVHTIKVLVYFSVGFSLAQHFSVLAGMVIATILGTYVGTKILDKIPEKMFLLILKWVIVILAGRMIYMGLDAYI